MASDEPDDSVRVYSILDRPQGEIAKMGKISVTKRFGRDYMSAMRGWECLHAGKYSEDFDKLLRDELMEKAKKRAKELHANAIVDFHLRKGTYSWGCSGTAVRVLKLVEKESSSEGGNNIKKEEDDKKTPAKSGNQSQPVWYICIPWLQLNPKSKSE